MSYTQSALSIQRRFKARGVPAAEASVTRSRRGWFLGVKGLRISISISGIMGLQGEVEVSLSMACSQSECMETARNPQLLASLMQRRKELDNGTT